MAGKHDFVLVTNTDWTPSLLWLDASGSPVNLTGFTAAMMIRSWPDSAQLASLTSGSGITLGGSAGTIALNLPKASTATIPAGVAKYDLLMTNGAGSTSALLYGDVIVRAAVTHS